jgi:hypothetical protein
MPDADTARSAACFLTSFARKDAGSYGFVPAPPAHIVAL